jgi:hypothetical protein
VNRRDIFLAIAGLSVAPIAIAKGDQMPHNLRVWVRDFTYCIYDLHDREWTSVERQCWDGETFEWKPVHPMNMQEGELVLAREARIIHRIKRAPFMHEQWKTYAIVADTWEY